MIEQLSGELLHYPKLSLYAFHLGHDMALAEIIFQGGRGGF